MEINTSTASVTHLSFKEICPKLMKLEPFTFGNLKISKNMVSFRKVGLINPRISFGGNQEEVLLYIIHFHFQGNPPKTGEVRDICICQLSTSAKSMVRAQNWLPPTHRRLGRRTDGRTVGTDGRNAFSTASGQSNRPVGFVLGFISVYPAYRYISILYQCICIW